MSFISVTDQHSGRYMVKATNAGGMAQSIADFIVGEAIPSVGLTKNYSFENKLSVATHEVIYFIICSFLMSVGAGNVCIINIIIKRKKNADFFKKMFSLNFLLLIRSRQYYRTNPLNPTLKWIKQ